MTLSPELTMQSILAIFRKRKSLTRNSGSNLHISLIFDLIGRICDEDDDLIETALLTSMVTHPLYSRPLFLLKNRQFPADLTPRLRE